MKILIMVSFIVLLFYMLFYFLSYKMVYNMEASSGYECGFNFITKTRISFSYRFFLIGILFLIFDVEIVLFLSIPFMILNKLMMYIVMLFISILILGLLYEYYYGSLEWVDLLISKA